MEDKKCCFWCVANRLGIFFVILFALCFAWGYVGPIDPAFHLQSLRSAFWGFSGMNVVSFIFGAVQVYVWAYILSGLWALTHRCCCGCNKCER